MHTLYGPWSTIHIHELHTFQPIYTKWVFKLKHPEGIWNQHAINASKTTNEINLKKIYISYKKGIRWAVKV